MPSYKSAPGRLTSELHERLASPLYPIAFVIVVVAFLGGAQTTRQNRLQAVIARVFARNAVPHTGHCGGQRRRRAAVQCLPALCGADSARVCWALLRHLPPGRTATADARAAPCRPRSSIGSRRSLARIAAARTRRLQQRRARGSGLVRAPNPAPLRGQALPVQHPGRVRCLRVPDLHDRHDGAVAHVAPRNGPFRHDIVVDGTAPAPGLLGNPPVLCCTGRKHRRAAEPQPEVRTDGYAVGRHVGMAVPAPGPHGRPCCSASWPSRCSIRLPPPPVRRPSS